MIAALYNIPTDPQTFSRFAFHNRDAHELVVEAIRKNTGLTLPQYPIDPIKLSDFASWLYTHQAMHNAVNGVLNVTGNDLSDMDPSKPEQLVSWIQLHASEHVKWGNILGLG